VVIQKCRLIFHLNQGRSDQYGNSSGGYPTTWKSSDAGPGFALFGFAGRCGDKIDAIAPIWAANSPVDFHLTNVVYAALPSTAVNRENVQFDKTHISNNTSVEQDTSSDVSVTYSVTQTHELSSSSRFLVGTHTQISYETPELIVGKIKGSFEIETQNEWTTSATDGTSKTTTLTKKYTVPIKVPPHSEMDTQAYYWSTNVQSLKWTGTLVVTYLDGSQKVSYTPSPQVSIRQKLKRYFF
jgi:hypothetical protein